MALLLGVDFGTSYFKVGLFDSTGGMRGLGRVAVEKQTSLPGRSELPVPHFWRLLRTGLAEALAQAGAEAGDIAGVSYSSQANTFVLLDHRDEPLTPLVLWTDRRAAPLEAAVTAFGASASFQRSTGFSGLAAEFAPVKWRWWQRQERAAWDGAARVMTLSDYFTYALTGESVGDAGTAAFTGVHSPATGNWWPEGLAFFDVDPARLSRPLAPGTCCGRTIPRARELLGLSPGVRFAVGSLDHHMAAIGSGLDRLADASISTGTVLAALVLVDAVAPVADCFHGPHGGGRFFRLAFDPAGAEELEAYRRQHVPQLSIAELVALAGAATAASVAPQGPGDKGSRDHGVVVRQMMERISAAQRVLLGRLQAVHPLRRVIATGGGSRSDAWLQITADAIGATVIAPRCHERACLAAAAFAAVAAGFYDDIPEALGQMVQSDRIVPPRTPKPETSPVPTAGRRN